MEALPGFDDDKRALAHQIVDRLFDHIQSIEKRPVVRWQSARELAPSFNLAERIGTADALSSVDQLLDGAIQLHHPAYMGHQVCPPAATAVLADLVISALNQSTAVWEMSPVGTVIEKEVIRWMIQMVGFPPDAAGTAVSGGSAANLTALLAARARWQHETPDARTPVLLCSADSHYSIARAAAIMGIPPADVLKIPTDARHRMDLDALEETLAALEEGNRAPLAIVATSGSTATGAFDELESIALLRDRYRTWLHVDAAHGASVLLSERLRHLVKGLERADSLSWDPHKMMWMPLSLGVVLVRNAAWLRTAFEADAPYLFNAAGEVDNLGELTIQCSRRADAVKLWLTLVTEGTQPIAQALDHVTDLASELHATLEAATDFEVLHRPEFNIFCFRYVGDRSISDEDLLDLWNRRLRQRLQERGEAWLTTTVLKGIRTLRVTLINPGTESRHLHDMIEAVRRAAAETAP